jgi:hypothetical protein
MDAKNTAPKMTRTTAFTAGMLRVGAWKSWNKKVALLMRGL